MVLSVLYKEEMNNTLLRCVFSDQEHSLSNSPNGEEPLSI